MFQIANNRARRAKTDRLFDCWAAFLALIFIPIEAARAQQVPPFTANATMSSGGSGESWLSPRGHADKLAKNFIIALQHANFTGNYTVIRDLLSYEAQGDLSVADLVSAFGSFRDNRIDLTPLAAEPLTLARLSFSLDATRQLIQGHYRLASHCVEFSVVHQIENRSYMIREFAISLGAVSNCLKGPAGQGTTPHNTHPQPERSPTGGARLAVTTRFAESMR